MRLNVAKQSLKTHEGATAKHTTPEQALRRSVLSCFLWEREFYEDGVKIADRIETLADTVSKDVLSALAVEARTDFNLRHVPLLLLCALVKRGGSGVADTIAETIQRPDEMMELLAMYWRDGRKPLAKQLQRGLAKALLKFDEYSLAKYDRDGTVKLRDVLFLSHAKPKTAEREELFGRIASRELVTPDTWEVGLSTGGDKRDTFERLLRDGKLGYLALLRNLRNMVDSGVSPDLIRDAILARKGAHRVLPFRYVAAARACPQMEPYLDQALCEAISSGPRLSGRTVILVDVSGSMDARLSQKSELTRMDAAATLASVVNGDLRVFTFSRDVVEVAPRRGMAGVDAVIGSQMHGITNLGGAVAAINAQVPHDRLIVITDEQSHTRVPDPVCERAYMINIASHKNGVGYGRWTHIDGFSESVLRFVSESECER